MKRFLLALSVLLTAPLSFSHDGPEVPVPLGLDPLLELFSWDMENAIITAEKVADNFYVLFGLGGNIGVSVGKDGVLIVDDQFPQLMPKIKSAIADLGGEKVDFAINTHWHFDHAEGNLSLGPDGTWLVSQANSREMMQEDHIINLVVASYMQESYPKEAWPVITYNNTMQFHFNDEKVDLMHFGPAHTTGDTAVIFRKTNAVHLGDVYNNAGYPFIDAGNGGTLEGLINFCTETIKEINKDTIVIPGHGPIADYQALVEYVKMLTTIRSRMVSMIEDGASLDDVYAANLTREWDEKNGDNTGFINRAYMSLTHKVIDR